MTPEQVDEMLDHVSQGVSLPAACRLVRLPVGLVYQWLERGKNEEERLAYNPKLKPKKSEEPCLKIWQDYNHADATLQAKVERSIYKQGYDGEWKALHKMLEARWPAQYGPAATQISLMEIEQEEEYGIIEA